MATGHRLGDDAPTAGGAHRLRNFFASVKPRQCTPRISLEDGSINRLSFPNRYRTVRGRTLVVFGLQRPPAWAHYLYFEVCSGEIKIIQCFSSHSGASAALHRHIDIAFEEPGARKLVTLAHVTYTSCVVRIGYVVVVLNIVIIRVSQLTHVFAVTPPPPLGHISAKITAQSGKKRHRRVE